MNPYPIVDLHCDLLYYLATVPGASPYDTQDIGASIPYLQSGNVRLQVMALFTPTKRGSASIFAKELEAWEKLLRSPEVQSFSPTPAKKYTLNGPIYLLPAIENASGICEDHETLPQGIDRLEKAMTICQQFLYISLTHHDENRFGGGNYSENVGLKKDGKILLDWMDGRGIAIDFSHSSDALALGILAHIAQQNLDIPLMASHSNFRAVCNHPRNLPNEIAQEIILRKGLIGINFVRDFVDKKDPLQLFRHVEYGWELGGENALAFGADFFYTRNFPFGKDRFPLFFPEHENAGVYPNILSQLQERGASPSQLASLSHGNFSRFIEKTMA